MTNEISTGYGDIGLTEVRMITRNLFLVGEHQGTCLAEMSYLSNGVFDGREEIFAYHVDAHADMESTNGLFPESDAGKIFEIAQAIRQNGVGDATILNELFGRVGRASFLRLLAQIGWVDRIFFAANSGYDFADCYSRGIIPKSIIRIDGKAVPVETGFIDTPWQPSENANVLWDIDDDYLDFDTNNRRARNEDVTEKTARQLTSTLHAHGLDLNKKNQAVVVSHDKHSFDHPNSGLIDKALVEGILL